MWHLQITDFTCFLKLLDSVTAMWLCVTFMRIKIVVHLVEKCNKVSLSNQFIEHVLSSLHTWLVIMRELHCIQ
jgi:hypothetical protein